MAIDNRLVLESDRGGWWEAKVVTWRRGAEEALMSGEKGDAAVTD